MVDPVVVLATARGFGVALAFAAAHFYWRGRADRTMRASAIFFFVLGAILLLASGFAAVGRVTSWSALALSGSVTLALAYLVAALYGDGR